MPATLSALTTEYLGQSATDADLAAFKAAVEDRMDEAGEDEATAIAWAWNDGAIRPEALA